MGTRANKFYVFIGQKYTGKSTTALELAAASKKKICVIDTDEHPMFREFEAYRIEDLHKWKDGNIRIVTSEPLEAISALNKYCANAFIMLEDTAKYISQNVQQEIRRFIIDHRKRNFDVVMMFHYLQAVPPDIIKQLNHIVLFKTRDNLSKNLDKYPNWHIVQAAALRIQKHKDMHYCETIDE